MSDTLPLYEKALAALRLGDLYTAEEALATAIGIAKLDALRAAPPSDPADPLREALQEVADWFATMPLADVGIVGAGYLGRDVIERADVVADRVRAALAVLAPKETDEDPVGNCPECDAPMGGGYPGCAHYTATGAPTATTKKAGPEGPALPEPTGPRGLATGEAYPDHITDSPLREARPQGRPTMSDDIEERLWRDLWAIQGPRGLSLIQSIRDHQRAAPPSDPAETLREAHAFALDCHSYCFECASPAPKEADRCLTT